MIIGNGLIARAFMGLERALIFASGVSNSLETDLREFQRESDILDYCLSVHNDETIVYFSSYRDSSPAKSAYFSHKQNMEDKIRNSGNNYIILALPQVIGRRGNPNSLINFIVNKIKSNDIINVYKGTYRSIIDIEDVRSIVDIALRHRITGEIDVPYIERVLVEDIVRMVGTQLGEEPRINLVPCKDIDPPRLSVAVEALLFDTLRIEPLGYTKNVIKKYVR